MDGGRVLAAADLGHADVAFTANVRGDLDATVEAELRGRRDARIVVRKAEKQRLDVRGARRGPGGEPFERRTYLIVRADVPDERDAQRRDRLDATNETSFFDHRSGPAPTLAFAKHTGAQPKRSPKARVNALWLPYPASRPISATER